MATYCPEDPVSFDLSCPICFEDYDILSRQRAPKLLLCLHTFCFGCAQQLWRSDGTLECSLCRCVHSQVALAELFDNPVIFQHLRKKREEEDLELARTLDREMRRTARTPNPPPDVIDLASPKVEEQEEEEEEEEDNSEEENSEEENSEEAMGYHRAVLAALGEVAAEVKACGATLAAVVSSLDGTGAGAGAAAGAAAASVPAVAEHQQRNIMNALGVMASRVVSPARLSPIPILQEDDRDDSDGFSSFSLFDVDDHRIMSDSEELVVGDDDDSIALDIFDPHQGEDEVEYVEVDEPWMPLFYGAADPASEGEDASLIMEPGFESPEEQDEGNDEEVEEVEGREEEQEEQEEQQEEQEEQQEEQEEQQEEQEEEEEDRWHSASDDITCPPWQDDDFSMDDEGSDYEYQPDSEWY